MKHFDKELSSLARDGFRSPEDWATLNREVLAEAAPRLDTTHRGRAVSLYTRDQTRVRPKAAPAATPPPPPDVQ